MHNEVVGPWKQEGEGHLEAITCQDTNRVDGSLIQPLVAELCRAASRMKMLFRDTWSLSVRDDMLIVDHGKSIIKRLKKGLGSQFAMKDLCSTQKILGMNYISPKKDRRNVIETVSLKHEQLFDLALCYTFCFLIQF